MLSPFNANFSTRRDMSGRSSQRMKWAIAAGIVLAVPLTFLAKACGNFHGGPSCGVFTFLALLFVVPTLVVESWLFASPPNTWAFWIIFEVVAFAIAAVVAFAVLTLVSLVRRT